MGALPKPLIGLLVGTVALSWVWTVTLKPHQSVTTSNRPNVKLGAPPATGRVQAGSGVHTIRAGKVVAVLFYNGAAADDQAMRHELAALPTHRGQVVKLAQRVSDALAAK
jgi:hypothetical protein